MVSCQGCGETTSNRLCCPICASLMRTSFFCSQECFVQNWASHSKLHEIIKQSQITILSNGATPSASRSTYKYAFVNGSCTTSERKKEYGHSVEAPVSAFRPSSENGTERQTLAAESQVASSATGRLNYNFHMHKPFPHVSQPSKPWFDKFKRWAAFHLRKSSAKASSPSDSLAGSVGSDSPHNIRTTRSGATSKRPFFLLLSLFSGKANAARIRSMLFRFFMILVFLLILVSLLFGVAKKLYLLRTLEPLKRTELLNHTPQLKEASVVFSTLSDVHSNTTAYAPIAKMLELQKQITSLESQIQDHAMLLKKLLHNDTRNFEPFSAASIIVGRPSDAHASQANANLAIKEVASFYPNLDDRSPIGRTIGMRMEQTGTNLPELMPSNAIAGSTELSVLEKLEEGEKLLMDGSKHMGKGSIRKIVASHENAAGDKD